MIVIIDHPQLQFVRAEDLKLAHPIIISISDVCFMFSFL